MKTRFTIQETADAVGISRSSLYKKYFATGILSRKKDDTDKVYVDASELARVFPDADISGEKKNWKSLKDAPEMSKNDVLSQEKTNLLDERLREIQRLHREIDWFKAELKDQAERYQALLEHKPVHVEPPKKANSSLLARLAKAVLNE